MLKNEVSWAKKPSKGRFLYADFYFDNECIGFIKQFSRDFGQGYIEEQLRSCDYYKNELIKQREKMKEKSIKEKKLRLALCLCASFSVILLLI